MEPQVYASNSVIGTGLGVPSGSNPIAGILAMEWLKQINAHEPTLAVAKNATLPTGISTVGDASQGPEQGGRLT